MMADAYRRVGQIKTEAEFRAHLAAIGVDLPMDERILSAADGSPLAEPMTIGSVTVGNRWCIHPMEGWDGTPEGMPDEHTLYRWRNFGLSGAKLIWGGEAVAVQHDGRENPNQLLYRPENTDGFRQLHDTLVAAHRDRFGTTDDLLVGLQLTHSGRFSRSNDKAKLTPLVAYRHPMLDARVGDVTVLSDDAIGQMIDNYIATAKMAHTVGFRFVDIKHCHGYLGHEFLSAYDRPGPYGGDLRGRTQFMRQIIEGVRAECPGLMIGVRLSVFDMPPFHPRETDRRGEPDDYPTASPYPAFGCRRDDPLTIDLTEPIALLELMRDELKVDLVNLSAGSPYYNPHIQRPAYYPPSDGYLPPEDPLVGCARQIHAVRELKQRVPGLPMVGTAYTYFQEYLPHIAQAVVRDAWVDFVGVGRLVLSYPDLPADCLETGALRNVKKLCRTFSDCTTAPRSGLVSGCYPLDEHYKALPEAQQVKSAKIQIRQRLRSK